MTWLRRRFRLSQLRIGDLRPRK
ncbi:hypothetical protein LINPERHAP1_LOCUS21936 [Linum perenne]